MKRSLKMMTLCLLVSCFVHAQVPDESKTPQYQSARRDLVPDKWYLNTPAMLRVTLKKEGDNKKLSLDSAVLERQLDSIVAQGYTALEIFATPHGGKSFGGLDAIDRYNIDPSSGNMADFRRLVRQAHRKHLAIIAFDNLGYSSVDAPHFLKACRDVAGNVDSKEAKWFIWADSDTAAPPMTPDTYFLGGTRRWEKWVYHPVAKKYYWSKWDGVDKNGKKCSLPQYNWSPEWQAEVKNIVRFWMNTGIDGMVIDAVNWYINYTWQMGKECITDVIAPYGNVFMQPEGAGGFHEDPVPWITEGGWNCVQNYGLGIWWEKDNNLLVNAINGNNTSGIEEALQNYRDRVVAEKGVLYVGADLKQEEERKYHLYVAFSIATGHIYCKSMKEHEKFSGDEKLRQILEIKRSHTAFSHIGRRQHVNTSNDKKFYAFVQKSHDNRERILCIFNFQDAPQNVSIDLSGINAAEMKDLPKSSVVPFQKELKVSLPEYGWKFYELR